MAILEGITKLLSLLPAGGYGLFAGIVGKLLEAKNNTERMTLLRKAALAVGYKEGARVAMDAALKARAKF